MKTKIKAIVIAMVLYSIFAGFAAAESPDAGDTWDTAKSFAAPNNAFTMVDGTLTEDPDDGEDMWYSYDPNVGDELWIYLDNTAYQKYIAAELYDGNHDLMQRLQKDGKIKITEFLAEDPTFVFIDGSTGDGDYTFALSRNW